MKQFNQDF